MELEYPWGDSETSKWLYVLSLPTLEWAAPFLTHLDLPEQLLEHPEVWQSIYTEAVTNYQTRKESFYAEIATEIETRFRLGDWTTVRKGECGQIMRQVVIEAFQKLAEQMGQEVAIDLEQWMYFQFFCSEFKSAMSEWRVILSYAYLPEDSRRGQRKVPSPTVLISMQPEIYDLVSLKKCREITDAMERIAPPAPEKQIPKMERCYESILLFWALNQARSLRALRKLASRLNDTEREEVVAWAKAQLYAMDSKRAENRFQQLCGDKYLQVEFPLSNIPSVLNLPAINDADGLKNQ